MYYLGVDGGGTETEALICDQNGVVKGRGLAGIGNYQIDPVQAFQEIKKAIHFACNMASITIPEITFTCFGLAGADREKDLIQLNKLLKPLGMKHFEIKVDAYIGLRAVTQESKGIALVCGTSTNAIGVKQDELFQLGGFGYPFGDYGGGAFLSKEIFRHVIRVAQGREKKSKIVELVLDELHFSNVKQMHAYYLNHLDEIPLHLTPMLFQAAQYADEFALRLLDKQAKELALSTYTIFQKLFNRKSGQIPVVLIGSVLTKPNTQILYEKLSFYMNEYGMNVQLHPLDISPVIGANLVALKKSS